VALGHGSTEGCKGHKVGRLRLHLWRVGRSPWHCSILSREGASRIPGPIHRRTKTLNGTRALDVLCTRNSPARPPTMHPTPPTTRGRLRDRGNRFIGDGSFTVPNIVLPSVVTVNWRVRSPGRSYHPLLHRTRAPGIPVPGARTPSADQPGPRSVPTRSVRWLRCSTH